MQRRAVRGRGRGRPSHGGSARPVERQPCGRHGRRSRRVRRAMVSISSSSVTSSPASSPTTAPSLQHDRPGPTLRSAPPGRRRSAARRGRPRPVRRSSFCTSALAPTSMPRVGSSSSSTFGFRRASGPAAPSAGCRRTARRPSGPGSDALMRSRFMKVSTIRVDLRPRETRPKRDSRGSAASTMFSRTDRPGTMPSALRSSGSRLIPARIAAARSSRRAAGTPATVTLPAVQRQRAGDRLGGLGAPRAEQPAEADDLAGADVERDVVQQVPARQAVGAAAPARRRRRRASPANLVRPSPRTSAMSRPSIRETSRSRSSSASGPVCTRRPSRSTVTVSQIRVQLVQPVADVDDGDALARAAAG